MERYDYRDEMYNDIYDYIDCNHDRTLIANEMTQEEAYEKLYDELWTENSVTGNASGSYWMSTWKAEEAICHNFNLWEEANEEFGGIPWKGPETADVTIRCYLLSEILTRVISEIYEDRTDEEEE